MRDLSGRVDGIATIVLSMLLSLSTASFLPATAGELIMFDSKSCTICRRFEADIGDRYADSKSAETFPLLDAERQHRSRSDFEVLAVNLDAEPEALHAFLDRVPVTFPVLLDPERRTTERFAVDGVPYGSLIDRSGRVRHRQPGYRPGSDDRLRRMISKLVEEAPSG